MSEFNSFNDNAIPQWAENLNYYHHSAPHQPDVLAFYNKVVARPRQTKAKLILNSATSKEHDKIAAKKVIESLENNSVKMMCGVGVQQFCDLILIHDDTYTNAYRHALASVQSYTPPHWKDKKKEAEELARTTEDILYLENGKPEPKLKNDFERSDKQTATKTEFELVCANAVAGLQEVTENIDTITGEVSLWKTFEGLDLPYNGRPDYLQSVELKTKWSGSLPKIAQENWLIQVAGYWGLTGINQTLVAANRLGYRVYTFEIEQLKEVCNQNISVLKRREELLKQSKNVKHLFRQCNADFNDWLWKFQPPIITQELYQLCQ